MKHIIISNCYACPYRIIEGDSVYLRCTETNRTIPDDDIPSWCPLPELVSSEGEIGQAAPEQNHKAER